MHCRAVLPLVEDAGAVQDMRGDSAGGSLGESAHTLLSERPIKRKHHKSDGKIVSAKAQKAESLLMCPGVSRGLSWLVFSEVFLLISPVQYSGSVCARGC